jgi:AraC-like DNA-binding protein
VIDISEQLSSRILLRSGAHVTLGHGSLTRVRQTFDTLANHTSSVSAERFAAEVIAAAFSLLIFTIAGLQDITAAIVARQPRDELVARFLDLLEVRFRVGHQASSYARALHVSLRTLDRHVLADRGQTARQAIAARLVLEAKRMLTGRDMPIKNIAYELGFSEPQNFTRFFSTQIGSSPELFRTSLDV